MATTVRIPPTLRAATGGAKEVVAEGSTVGEVFKHPFSQHPSLEARVLGEDGKVHRYLNVFVEGKDESLDIRFEDGLNTPVPDGQSVSILAAVAGG
jgi:molybdopterin converting factor small subunit